MQYSTSEGYPPLLQWIVGHMARQGIAATTDNLIITNGSQQALDFLARLLLTPGDTVLVTSPTYLGALQAFSAYEPRYDTIRPEHGNRTPTAYREAAAAATPDGAVKYAYIVPDFANPSGETLSREGREKLLDLAHDLDIAVLEDTAYRPIRFEGEDLPSLQELDIARTGSLDRSRVAYLGTFSKTMAPGLRLGWICASRALIARLVLIKQASDLNASVINQMVMHRLVTEHHDTQVQAGRTHYRAKRDAMLEALAAEMPPGVKWSTPEGGLFVWLTLPEHIDGADLLQRAVREARVAFVPGGAFFHDGTGRNTARLSYSLPEPATTREGIRRLAAIIRAI